MAAIKPSLILDFNFDSKYENAELEAEVKRTYSYIACPRVMFDGEGVAEKDSASVAGAAGAAAGAVDGAAQEMAGVADAEGAQSEELAPAPAPDPDGGAGAGAAFATENTEVSPVHGTLTLNIVSHMPYWGSTAEEAQYWTGTMVPWLERILKKLNNTVSAHDEVRASSGQGGFILDRLTFNFHNVASLDIALEGNVIDVSALIEQINAWHTSK